MTGLLEKLSPALADRYRITRQLGQGGMATVFLADDLRHDRRVAIKVLKPELAAVLGADRFVVEIKTTASLSHPHILPLFDSGTAHGFLYYVMPYIEGETIREKLNRETQFGVDEAVRITREVADALDYAHRHGVIHRDIKPENILLHDGRAMVMDFGIALAVSAAAGGRMTETGLSLGTPHYMSPEQATAEKELTNRSDIYSLGCVLYEMLAGQPPHLGGSAQQVIMKIVTDTARPVTELRKSVPANVAAAASRALEKLPADRFESAKAFSDALANPAFMLPGTAATRAGLTERNWRNRVAVPALAAVGLLLLGLVWTLTRPEPARPVIRYRVALSAGHGLSGSPWSRLTISPNGSTLVYAGERDQNSQLYVRPPDQLDGAPLPGTEGAINPTFSPDGNRVAFMDRVPSGTIKVVTLSGGVTVITDSAVGAPGLAWGADGYIYYDRLGVGPLMRVPETGGKAESVGQLDSARRELQHSWPDVLPNGKGVIMTVSHSGPGVMGGPDDEIAVLDLATGKHRVLFRGVFARYARSGHLVYVTTDGALMAVPFDQDRMQLAGDPVALAEGVGVRVGGGAVDLAISANGVLWYAHSIGQPGSGAGGAASAGTFEAVWVTRDGAATVVPGVTGLLADPALSPDGRRLAISVRLLNTQVFIKELEQGPFAPLTARAGGSNNMRPAWSADGKSVAFVSERIEPGSNRDLYQRGADGSRPATVLLDDAKPVEEVTFSRDGSWMLYRTGTLSGTRDLYARRLGSDSAIALLTTSADETAPALSPDGHWLAYVSDESGSNEVYVRPFPNTNDGRWQISAHGGGEPVWAHSGRELFYRTAVGTTADSQMVMAVTTGARFIPGARRALFSLTRYVVPSSRPQYVVSPDDKRFLMIRGSQSNASDQLIVVENFFEVLRARVARK